jgi:3'-phosphoadenosine 5'-phosphosulfate (PAPS) 3'-phosphatase
MEGAFDACIYINQGNCRWDSCAGDAILHAMGGVFTNQLGKHIRYDPDAATFTNDEGNVCCFDKDLHRQIVETYARISAKGQGNP